MHTAFAAPTEEQWEPTPHTTHTSSKAGFCDGESAAYEAFCEKILSVFWQSSGYISCMQMEIAHGGGASFRQIGVSFDCPDFGELASKLEDASLPDQEVYFACACTRVCACVSPALSSAITCAEGGTRAVGAG